MNIIKYFLLVHSILSGADPLSPFIKRYEGLSYNREALHQSHQRAKRTRREAERTVQLEFSAYDRKFHLRLKRDSTGFTEDFQIHFKNSSEAADTSHIYSGELAGESHSVCHGSVIDGQFEGFIQTQNGTFYIEPTARYTKNSTDYHSLIYHEDDIDYSRVGPREPPLCGTPSLGRYAESLRQEILGQDELALRSKRTLDYSKTSCMLYLRTDHLYFKKFGSVEAVVAQIGNYMRAVNDIYDKADFEGIRLINFKVKTLHVISDDDPSSLQYSPFIGPEKLLMLHSRENWDNYCLSYLMTDRDYNGVLGLAWEGKPGNSGGICSRYAVFQDGTNASLNTGLVTLQKYGDYLPPKLVHLTMAHELGHSLGSPHDEKGECEASTPTGGQGNFLMFPYASEGNQGNNDRFSPCSVKHISKLLRTKKDKCFIESGLPICGNQIVEDGEECDVGHNDTDPCCYSASQSEDFHCKLKPQKQCSPSQGKCCSHQCVFKPQGQKCQQENDCEFESECSGVGASCPSPTPKANMTTCHLGTRVCINGKCDQSLCVKYGLEQCGCLGNSMKEKCYICCQKPGKPSTCASTTSSVLFEYFRGAEIALPAGTACSDRQGYCDKFNICRLVDADGPIARLKNSFLRLNEFEDLAEWMKAYWWGILLVILALSTVMASTVFLFGHTADSSPEEHVRARSKSSSCPSKRQQRQMQESMMRPLK
ncbi:disintegrin and metalloproteinase domain-containing protein 10-like [Huso huso]|uniref:ADAM10 endopeptidase n=1 Tax=Huso huso TaxID=61971 RepID=A0ABR0Y4P7_HUSHU